MVKLPVWEGEGEADACWQALLVMDACNLSGIVRSWAEITASMPFAWGTDGRNRHPVCQLFAAKVIELTGMGFADPEQFSAAYRYCQEKAGVR